MLFDTDLPIIDLRDSQAYQKLHPVGATHLPWPEIQTLLNQLPAAPADLQLLGNEHQLSLASQFLNSKNYQIVTQVDEPTFEVFAQKQPGLVVSGSDFKRLWQPSPLVLEFLENHSITSGKVLDLGCGGGRDAVYLSMRGYQVTAIDHKSAVMQRAQQLALAHQQTIEWRCCDVNESECLPDKAFDVILVIRYLNRGLFDWISAHLKPGGFLIFQTFSEGVEAFGSPRNPNFILRNGELAKTFTDFEIIVDKIERLSDGRPVASFIAKKT